MSNVDPELILSTIRPAPADPILGLNEEVAAATKAGRNPINLGVGVYRDEAGNVPVLKVVREIEAVQKREGKGYLPITGLPEFNQSAQELLFLGAEKTLKSLRDAKRITSSQVVGGTGGVSLAQALLRLWFKQSLVLVSDPTWAPHATIFKHQMPDGETLGFKVETYPYWDGSKRRVRFEEMCERLEKAPERSIIVLHGCCQNPTGMDLVPAQSKQILEICLKRGHIPVIDIAYQGFGDGLEQDGFMVKQAAELLPFFIAIQSFSKTMSFYDERIGVLHLVTSGNAVETGPDSKASLSEVMDGWIKTQVRRLWSNPGRPVARLAHEILSNPSYNGLWRKGLEEMRLNVINKRHAIAHAFKQHGLDFSFVSEQKGIFSFTGLIPEAVNILKRDHAIFMTQDGRMNVAALSTAQLPKFVEAVTKVVRDLKLKY